MKKLLFLLAFAVCAKAGFSQTSVTPIPEKSAPAVVAIAAFASQNYDFGKIKQGVPVTHEFKFTNKGTVPMVITAVQASCGCTTPSYTSDPIPPQGQGFIKATFNAAAAGGFNKTVTVTANVESGFVQLAIRGEVVAAVQ